MDNTKSDNAHEKGYDSYVYGQNKSENPYDEELQTELYEAWEEGWFSANSDCDSE